MKIWAFDPGSVETGVAYLNLDIERKIKVVEWQQFADLHQVWDFYHAWRSWEDVVLIEAYRSAGHLTKHAQNTIEVVGALKFAVERDENGPEEYTMRVEQHRLSGRRDATKFFYTPDHIEPEDQIMWIENDKGAKDGFSALSHCFAYWRATYAGTS